MGCLQAVQCWGFPLEFCGCCWMTVTVTEINKCGVISLAHDFEIVGLNHSKHLLILKCKLPGVVGGTSWTVFPFLLVLFSIASSLDCFSNIVFIGGESCHVIPA